MPGNIELRWFVRGTLPTEVKDWFGNDILGRNLGKPEEREDIYLYIPDDENLNIKTRQGRLEIKWRQAQLDVMRFGDNVEGKAEKWVKWSCEDPAVESLVSTDRVSKPWVSVKKVRSQRHYQFTDNSLTPVSTPSRSIDGCSVEITDLLVRDNPWWSLAFETFGDRADSIEQLKVLASWMLNSYQKPSLLLRDSYAYSHWLFEAI